jgi:YebC/PmpR family DNA-binding regulatory protein
MAGHSKWANVQWRLAAQDKRRGKILSKLIREISVATRVGGADPGSNARLRVALHRARALSVPHDAIDQALRLAASEARVDARMVHVRCEGYGPGGAVLLVDCLTDNRTRTVAELRHLFAEHGGHLGAKGSVGYLFNQVGHMVYAPGTHLDELMAVALQAGAEDVLASEDGTIEVLTDPLDFETVRAQLEADGFPPAASEITERASTTAALQGEAAVCMLRLLDQLEDLDDVLNVYSNAEIPNEVLARV